MKTQVSLFHKTLPISVLPLAAGGASYILQKLGYFFTEDWTKDQIPFGSPSDSSQNEATNSIFSLIMLFLQQVQTLVLDAYDNYLVFLVMMMILHIGIYHRTKKNQSQEKQSFLHLREIVSLIICYTISFYSLKLLLAILLTTSHSHSSRSQIQTATTNFPFTVIEVEMEDDYEVSSLSTNRMLIEQKSQFLKVINQVEIPDLSPLNVIFSKDFQSAFEVDMNKSLVIYNISNLEDPTPISVLDDTVSKSDLFSFGLLSPTGELLFIGGEYIQIVNVADLKHPSLLSQIQFREEEDLTTPVVRRRPSLAVSSDENYLICSDPKLRIYDISDLEEPKLLFHDELLKATTVILSDDDLTAFVGSKGELKIFNVTDFNAPEQIGSFPIKGEVLTCTLSEDQETLYIISYTDEEDAFEQVLSIVNVANVTNPIGKKYDLKSTDNILGTSLTISPDKAFLVLQSVTKLVVINLDNLNLVTFSRNLVKFQNLAFLPNGKNAVSFSGGLYELFETYFNIPYSQADSLQPNHIAKLDFGPIPYQIISHPSGERAFVLALQFGAGDDKKVLLDINLEDSSEPEITETFDLTSTTASLFVLSSDGDSIYYRSRPKTLQILSTEDELSKQRSIKLKHDFEQMFIVSSDEETLFTLSKNETHQEAHGYLSIYDISDSSPQLLSTLIIPIARSRDAFQSPSIYMRLSPDEKTLFLLDLVFFTINVTDLRAPVFHEKFIWFKNVLTKALAFSSDYKTCFVLGASLFSSQKTLWAINTTDFANPEVVNRLKLPLDTKYWLSTSDDQLFLTTSKYFLTSKIIDGTKLELKDYKFIEVSTFTVLQKTQNILICNYEGLQVLNPRAKYALYTPNYRFKLGQIFSIPLKVLELNKYNNYASFSENYKFIHASLSKPVYEPFENMDLTLSVLPNWMSFDKENALLNLDLTLPLEIASYEIRSKVSTQISSNSFLGIEGANYTDREAKGLLVHLVAQGYLDSEKYLTSTFDEKIPLILSEEYSEFEGEIQNILKSHTIEMLTSIFVDPSLSLEKSEFLQVTTASKNPISVTIKLVPEQAKFVTQGFSGVKTHPDDHKASLTLEGPLSDINSALESLLINVQKDGQPCEGNIVILDGLNPPLEETCDDITEYFKINGQPEEKYSVQSQINNAPVIIAGQRFNIDLNEATFTDPNERELAYSLEMIDKKAELPGWISLREQSLSGTPPEAFLPYTKTFVLRASNEFKSEAIVFTLKIRLSWVTIASKFLFIVGYLFTAFKTWQHSDKIYNIFCKSHYTYPVIFKIVPAREITKETIFPIALITKEIQGLSKAILNEIKKDFGQGNDKQLIDYLTNDGDLSKERLAEIIEEIVIAQESKDRISEYHKQDGFNKKLIYQLILNELTFKRIKLSNQKITLGIFEKIKLKWIELVDLNEDSDGFSIKNESFARELQAYNINIASANQSDTTTEYSLDDKVVVDDDDTESLSKKIPTKKSIEKELVKSSGSQINIGLLKDAILAHAFSCQNLQASRNDINIQSRELSNTKNALMKFARFDTKSLISHSTKRLGYGLKYEYVGNQIVFYGELQEQMKNKTMVVQILSKGGWILRELFIQSPADDIRNEKRSLVEFVHAEL